MVPVYVVGMSVDTSSVIPFVRFKEKQTFNANSFNENFQVSSKENELQDYTRKLENLQEKLNALVSVISIIMHHYFMLLGYH